jgi:hypothetical protein
VPCRRMRCRRNRSIKDEAKARTAFEAARAQREKILQAQPDYRPPLCVLAMIDVALGHKELALEQGRSAIALAPMEKDAAEGSSVPQYFASRPRGHATRS